MKKIKTKRVEINSQKTATFERQFYNGKIIILTQLILKEIHIKFISYYIVTLKYHINVKIHIKAQIRTIQIKILTT